MIEITVGPEEAITELRVQTPRGPVLIGLDWYVNKFQVLFWNDDGEVVTNVRLNQDLNVQELAHVESVAVYTDHEDTPWLDDQENREAAQGRIL